MEITVKSIQPYRDSDVPVMGATVSFHLVEDKNVLKVKQRFNTVEVRVFVDKNIKSIDDIHDHAVNAAFDVLQKILDRRPQPPE